MEEKLNLAGLLAFRLTEAAPEIDDDIAWGYADGIFQKRICNILNGRCSLKSSLEFDLKQEDRRLDDNIAHLRRSLER